MEKKIILAGGTGFVGQYLHKKFVSAGYMVILVSRHQNHIHWNNSDAISNALEHADMLINLAGKSVDCRYSEKNKKEIYNSRIDTTNILGAAMQHCKNPPPLWINAGTATIYRHAQDRPMTESTGEIGSGFSVNVASGWEKAFFSFALPATRRAALRMAIVLGKGGGVLKPLKNLVRFGFGGIQGKGDQMFSWIHLDDVFNAIMFIRQHPELSGVINTAAPNPVTNKTLMQSLRKTLGVKAGLPLPKWLLEIGAVFIKTETELILKSRWVIPERLLQAGFKFTHANLQEALEDILNDKPPATNQ